MKKTVLILATMLLLNACSIFYEKDPRNMSTAWQDNQLTVRISGVKNKDPFISDVRLNIVAYDGNVILIGQSRSAELKQSLIEKVRVMEGVKKVYDQIHIKEPISFSQRTRDTWLTARVKGTLMIKNQLLDANIKVVTENAEVFLFGYVSPDQAAKATEIVRNINGVDRVIQAWF